MRKKIRTRRGLKKLIPSLRQSGKRIVFTNGCFDILHIGHIRYLERARRLGDILVVGINSDASVRTIKGKQRPIVPERERAEVIAALESADYVTIFDEPDPAELIRAIKPDVIVKGADWAPERIVGREIVEGRGGKTVTIPLVPGASTSSLIERIVKVSQGRKTPARE